jgi:hypothetical protein
VLHVVNAFTAASDFARSIDLRGDLDGDGFADLAIGSPLMAPTQSGSGAVLDFGHSWLPRAILTRVDHPNGTSRLAEALCAINAGLPADERPEIVVSLHACDTATDEALARLGLDRTDSAASDHLPVVVDPSQGTGKAHLVEPMCRASVACGADGLIIEVHNDPEHAMTDGAQSITPAVFKQMMKNIARVAAAVDREV